MQEPVTRCERCDKSSWCMKLKPCDDYAPALGSIFLAEVKILEDQNLEILNYSM